jgi:diadenylate cyclase
LTMFGWLRDIFDILLLAFIIYEVLLIFQRTRVGHLVKGLIIFAAFFLVAHLFDLRASRFIFDALVIIIPIFLLIIFQPELRTLFEGAGRHGILFGGSGISRLKKEEVIRIIDEIIAAMEDMSEKKIGALIVLEGEQSLADYIETGEEIDAVLKAETLVTIFYPHTPLHDGAVIVEGDRVVAARCFLPLSENTTIPSHLGTRHRAALGLTELTDSITLVVSEETGRLSLCYEGRLAYNLTPQALRNLLRSIIYPQSSAASVIHEKHRQKPAAAEKPTDAPPASAETRAGNPDSAEGDKK